MDTWVKVVIGGAVAYFAYEMFFAVPASWTAVGGTSAQWSALSSANQTLWNGLTAAQQTAANANVLIAATNTAAPSTTATAGIMPTSWTTAGGTTYGWSILSAPQQAYWNQLPTASQNTANLQAILQGQSATATAPGGASSPSATGGNPTAAPVGMTLASLAAAIQAQSAGDGNLVNGAMSGDHWNYYANLITGKTLPGGWASGPMTFAQYWATQSPVIAAATGLGSIMAGLGALVRARGGRWGMGDYVPSSTDPFSMTADTAGDSSVPYARVGHVADIDWN